MNLIPKIDYTKNIIDGNTYEKIIFFPGMLFGSTESWWGKGGKRPAPHEGMDICLYSTPDGKLVRIRENSPVQAVWQGRVENILDDYIAKSIILSHPYNDETGRRLFSIYAHVNPLEHIKINCNIKQGDKIACISNVKKDSALLPHLHLSIAWGSKNFIPGDFQWQTIMENNELFLVDPVELIGIKLSVIPFRPDTIKSIR